jgi:hypothetical protein
LDFRPDLAGTLVVAVPLISAAAIDVTSTIGWSRYLGEFCAELRGPAASIDPQEFNQRRRSLRYGWTWTNPMLSALVRPAESNAVVPNPGQPVEAAAEAVSGFGVRYKSRGSICAAAS